MRIIRTEKQKDNLAKAFWDMGKVIFTVLVISPFANPAAVQPKEPHPRCWIWVIVLAFGIYP